jgi:hypothetical protein
MTGDQGLCMSTLEELLDQRLSLNCKERYYTGTVLAALLCTDNMAHLARLGTLLRPAQKLDVRADPDDCTVVFFTEYGISESAVGAAKERFAGLPTSRDTPDVVILVTEPQPALIALKAKLYDRPSRPELLDQLGKQKELLEPLTERLASWLGVEMVTLVHAALLPEPQKVSLQTSGPLPVAVITWQELLATYSDVAPPYWHAVFAAALARYDDLVSKRTGYPDNELPGQVLVDRWRDQDTTYPWMGRKGGLFGAKVATEVTSGAWTSGIYQCRKTELPGNRNWFAVAYFIALLVEHGQLEASAEPSSG